MLMNDTYGEISHEELKDMQGNARACVSCGMGGSVDPVFHESRYGHAPVIRDGTGELTWSSDSFSWVGSGREAGSAKETGRESDAPWWRPEDPNPAPEPHEPLPAWEHSDLEDLRASAEKTAAKVRVIDKEAGA